MLQHMIHNPCGSHNPAALCMGDRGCKKNFPKPFRSETQQSESEQYIPYRRRSPEEGGETATRPVRGNSEQRGDNSWVVAHNPKLMRMFHKPVDIMRLSSSKTLDMCPLPKLRGEFSRLISSTTTHLCTDSRCTQKDITLCYFERVKSYLRP